MVFKLPIFKNTNTLLRGENVYMRAPHRRDQRHAQSGRDRHARGDLPGREWRRAGEPADDARPPRVGRRQHAADRQPGVSLTCN